MLTVIVGVVADYISNLEVNLKTITYEDILEQEKQEQYERLQIWRQKRQVLDFTLNFKLSFLWRLFLLFIISKQTL